MKKRMLAALCSTTLVATTMFSSFTMTALASEPATTGTIYYDFEEITDVSQMTKNESYLFIKAQYGQNEAIVDLPGGSALLKYVGNDSETIDSHFGYRMYYADDSKMAQGAVDVVERGSGFDTCEAGTIAYVTKEELDAYAEAHPADVKFATYEKFVEITSSYLEGYYNSVIDAKENDPADYESFCEYSGLTDGFTYDDFCQAIYSLAVIPGRNIAACWRYACDGGGVSYVGPFWCYKYKTAEFTADNISAQMKPGFEIPSTATTVGVDQVVVKITLDGKVYDVPYYTIASSNNTLSSNDNDLSITVEVGGVEKTVTVEPFVPTKMDEVPAKTGAITDISGNQNVEDKNTLQVGFKNTEAELQTLFGITDAEKAAGVNVWIKVEIKEADVIPEDKAIIESGIGDDKVATYLDISLFKMATGDSAATKITNTNGNVKIIIIVPEALRKSGRAYKIAYTHEGGAAKIIEPVSYNEETGELVFDASEFSTYALIYGEKEATETPKTTVPKTGDNSTLLLNLLLVIVAAGSFTIVSAARRRKHN